MVWYRYVEKFHVEPDSWRALFEFLALHTTDTKIERLVKSVKEGSK